MKKKQKTKLTNLIIIDASGSMINKKEEVIGGLKQLFSKIQDDASKDVKTTISRTIVVDFSSPGDYRTLIDSSNSFILDESVADKYTTRGMTSLFDAIGKGFLAVGDEQDAVFVNILTDGEENSSREFNKSQISSLIKDKENKNWAITFMGTTKDAITKAQDLGIKIGNTFTYSDSRAGGQSAMDALTQTRSAFYSNTKHLTDLNLEERASVKKKNDNLFKDIKKK